MTGQELPRIIIERAAPCRLSGIQPQFRLTISGRRPADFQVQYLYYSGDIVPFLAGVHVGYTERNPDRLLKRIDAPLEESIFYEGVKVGLKVAGLVVALLRSPFSAEPYALACEDVGN